MLDLVTGQRRDYAPAQPSAYRLVGWSPDGRTLAVLTAPAAVRDIHETEPGSLAELTVLDLATGVLARVGQATMPLGEHYCFTGDGHTGG
ncbi:hypothetical protein AB0B66_34170 [Catellatospora sp. NPDC049111]|uniref:hypothetical protein n=1 Tax=Catellatospora sp. NPDC049111 TaxID=3155271 RepID=UPI0034084481